MRRSLRGSLPWLFVLACATDPEEPEALGPGGLPPNLGDHPVRPGQPAIGGSVPVMEGGPMFFTGGAFTFDGPTTAGSATFDAAPVWEWDAPDLPPPGGTGTWSVTLDGVSYAGTADEAMALVYEDRETGVDYLVLGEYRITTDAAGTDVAEVVYVVVPAADFAPGGSVALDGVDRVALFLTGPADAEEPALAGAAVTGTVTFDAGSLVTGDTVTASVTGDFGVIEWESEPVDPPVTDPLAEGAYTLAITTTGQVFCDGSLAGREADFALPAGDLGFVDGTVDVTAAAGGVEVSGAPITSGFGASPVLLTYDPEGLWFGWIDRASSGPLGTTLSASFLVLDATTITPTGVEGWVGVAWEDPPRTGMCQIGYPATMTGP